MVATPGRLWQLIDEGSPHLAQLKDLSFLVLDEADRMVQQGHFQELSNILDMINQQINAKTEHPMKVQDARKENKNSSQVPSMQDGDIPSNSEDGQDLLDHNHTVDDESAPAKRTKGAQKRQLQTMIFSATLTLPLALRRRLQKKATGVKGSTATLERLLECIKFRGEPKVIDLTSNRKLADGIQEAKVECAASGESVFCFCGVISLLVLCFAPSCGIGSERNVSLSCRAINKLRAYLVHATVQLDGKSIASLCDLTDVKSYIFVVNSSGSEDKNECLELNDEQAFIQNDCCRIIGAEQQ